MRGEIISFVVLCFLEITLAICPAGLVTEVGVVGSNRTIIVDRHNYWRDQVTKGKIPNQPKALDMLKMGWDATLAEKAQEITDNCVLEVVNLHDNRWMDVGQNIFIDKSTAPMYGANWTYAIDYWIEEYKNFHYPGNVGPQGWTGYKCCGRYTQIVWATSCAVGCGYTSWVNTSAKSFRFVAFYVCNYGPAGNYFQHAPYKTDNCSLIKF